MEGGYVSSYRNSRGHHYSGESTDSGEDANNDTAEISDWYLPIVLMDKRHIEKILGTSKSSGTWRMKERMKTVSVALVLCLNVGVDPPDVLKIQPCAREECWIDPLATGPRKALEAIGSTLQKQYERWQPRARSKLSLDPTLEEVKKLCQSLRRNAKEERVLFHYNGHGVPKPTENGEIWVFNKNYTQYIPLSLYTLQSWMGMPSIYVFDCSNSGLILDKFTEFQQQRDGKIDMNGTSMSSSTSSTSSEACRQCILLGACSATELLPQDPNLPADLFTSCLTTPIRMALRWYVLQTSGKIVKGITKELVDKIPGALNDRRTMLGELNWIFTAITDTIAWNVLPRETFQKLFRQDLLVASLFRNFLLAERIMRSYNCNPVSNQRLPSTYQHPMWQAWDFTLDACLSQLPAIAEKKAEFQYSSFFAEQLTAFQVWLDYGSINRNPPEQLPIVLQVLLSQVHRLRALDLLSRFLDHGPKAVSLALSVGIFPYVLKLLQSSARELRPLLVFIWAKILSVDGSCQGDLVKDNGHKYFLQVLDDRDMPSEYRTMAAFVLAMIVQNYKPGQELVHQGKAISICLLHLEYRSDHRLRSWCSLCLGQIWQNFATAKWAGVRDNAHEKLYKLLCDDVPEVRCAALFALGTFINQSEGRTEHATNVDHAVGMQICNMSIDPSPMVREELLSAIAGFITVCEPQFISIAHQLLEEEALAASQSGSPNKINSPKASPGGKYNKATVGSPYKDVGSSGFGSSDSLDGISHSPSPISTGMKRVASSGSTLGLTNVYNMMWRTLLQLTLDPFPSVNQQAGIIVNTLKNKASQLAKPRGVAISSSAGSRSGSLSAASSPSNRNLDNQMNNKKPFSPSSGEKVPSEGFKRQFSAPHTSASNSPTHTISPTEKIIDTEFFKWSCKMFEQSVMAEFCTHSPHLNNNSPSEKQSLYTENVKVRERALTEHLKAPYTRLETEIFANKMGTLPAMMRFHPYDIRLAVADNDTVGIWDWEAGVRQNHFYNHNSKTCKITGMEYLNPHNSDRTLLAVATDDGAVRIWKDFSTKSTELNLVTAWQAISDLSTASKYSSNSPGMVMEWQQSSTSLYFSGASRYIRLYDLNKETKIVDMMTGSEGVVTSMCCDSLTQSRLVGSFSDGSVRVFDRRLPPHDSRVCTFQHGSWVLNCLLQKGEGENLVSACRSGEIKFWDVRKQDSVGSFTVGTGLRSMVLHKEAELLACGMADQLITVFNTSGDTTSNIKYHEGFMGQRVAKVSCLAFHPHLVRLASGNVDSMVSVYTLSDKGK